jgi:hypothetical protein
MRFFCLGGPYLTFPSGRGHKRIKGAQCKTNVPYFKCRNSEFLEHRQAK